MNRTQYAKIKGMIQNYMFQESEIRRIQVEIDDIKQEMIKVFDESEPDEYGRNSVTVDYDDYLNMMDVTATRYDQDRVTIDEEKVKQVLSEAEYRSICDRTFEVDLHEMREVLDKHPEIRELVKRFVHAKYTISKDKFTEALSSKSIKPSKLKKCCEIKTTKCLRFSKKVKRQDYGDL